jgi:serine protease Do
VQNVVQQLKTNGMVSRGWLGVEIQPVSQDIADSLGLKQTQGALVASAQKNSPAAEAGVKPGDVITKVNGEPVANPRELARKIAALGPKKTVDLTVVRNDQTKDISVTLGQMANEKEASNEQPSSNDNTAQSDDAAQKEMAKLGLTLAPEKGGKNGVVVAEVDPDSTAAQKGLQQGDVILDAGGKPVSKASDVTAAIATAKSEGRKAVLLRVKSGDNVHFVALSTQAAT